MSACKSEEKCQLKAVAKTMKILSYVLTDSKSVQLVHNATIDTKPNELYGAVMLYRDFPYSPMPILFLFFFAKNQ